MARPEAAQMPGMAVWNKNLIVPSDLSKLPPQEKWTYLTEFGVLAPTSHNTVPQRFRVTEKGVGVFLDRALVLPTSDREGRQAAISIGCATENIVEAAKAYGMDPQVTILEKDTKNTLPGIGLVPMVAITAEATASHTFDKYRLETMKARRVNRAIYDERVPLPDALRSRITTAVGDFDGLHLHLMNSRGMIQMFGKFQQQADGSVMDMPEFRKELAEWFHANDEFDITRGMRGEDFGMVDTEERKPSQDFARGLRGERQLLPDEIAGFAKIGREGIDKASAVGIITAKKDDITSRINVGRAFQQIGLSLYEDDFSIAVHAALTETSFKAIWFISEMLKRTYLKTGDHLMSVFRIGKPVYEEDRTRPHSVRPQLQELLV
ncbi:MAG: hypothetical protein ACM3IJ_00745 [Candidatus Levyibacteriota bacterium]